MRESLVQHALQNVWCSPRQDRQCILKLTKITPFLGSKGLAKVLWDRIELPDQEAYYHVYQIGQNTPGNFGLVPKVGIWTRCSEMCNSAKMLIDLYLDNGLHFPLTDSWVQVTTDQNLIVAVRLQPTIASLDTNDLYMRVYSPAYFASSQSADEDEVILVRGGRITDDNHYSTIQTEYHHYRDLGVGHAYAFHNGYYVSDLLPGQFKRGDVFEWVYDSTIYRVVEWPVSELLTFDSTLDSKRKYLLHPPKVSGEQIDYRDDVDFWFYRPSGQYARKGVLVHKNLNDTVRMLTHADYSLSVQPLERMVVAHSFFGQLNQGTVRAHIRKSGYNRSLVFERHRIHELYKLDDQKLIGAMVGRNATVPEWQAANLEASAYTALMSAEYEDVTFERVVEAYGYNALSVVTAMTPDRPKGQTGLRYVDLPIGLQDSCTVFEYDSNGLLLQVNAHANGQQYVIADQDHTELVEVLSGTGGLGFETWFGGDPVTLDPLCEYRIFRTAKGYPNGSREWEDVTNTGDHQIVNNVLTFQSTNIYDYLVVSDRKFLVYQLKLNYRDHLLKFTINARNAEGVVEPIEYLPGELTLWLNRHRLIEGLDYFVKWPQVVICNKRYLDQTQDEQSIVIRAMGWAEGGKRVTGGDLGYVQHGILSINNRFDIRDDKVVSCVVDGRTMHRDQLEFREDSQLVRLGGVREGAPYQVSEQYVAIRGIEDYETQSMREDALAIDERVSGYLSYWLPEETIDALQTIPELHWLYSPFLAKVLWDLRNGIITVDSTYRTDKQIIEELESYRYLLEYDPAIKDLDTRYVSVHPHHSTTVLQVTQPQHAYLKRVNRLFLNDRVQMAQFLSIEGVATP